MNKQTPIRDERGFTLLEAVIAMAILAIGILTVCMMQGGALRASTIAYNRSEANNVATAVIEAMQQLPFDDPMLEATGDDEQKFEEKDDNSRAYNRDVVLVGSLGRGGSTGSANIRDGRGNLLDRGDTHFCRNDAGKCGSDSGGSSKLGDLLEHVVTVMSNDGDVMDKSGIRFDLWWAVQDVKVEKEDLTTDKIIRVFMEWDTPAGRNRLEYTTTKYSTETSN